MSCFIFYYAEGHYSECYYAESDYAECHYVECRYAECRGAIFSQAYFGRFLFVRNLPVQGKVLLSSKFLTHLLALDRTANLFEANQGSLTYGDGSVRLSSLY